MTGANTHAPNQDRALVAHPFCCPTGGRQARGGRCVYSAITISVCTNMYVATPYALRMRRSVQAFFGNFSPGTLRSVC
jgi:hypothetical protein